MSEQQNAKENQEKVILDKDTESELTEEEYLEN